MKEKRTYKIHFFQKIEIDGECKKIKSKNKKVANKQNEKRIINLNLIRTHKDRVFEDKKCYIEKLRSNKSFKLNKKI